MKNRKRMAWIAIISLLIVAVLGGCSNAQHASSGGNAETNAGANAGSGTSPNDGSETVTLTIGAYTVPKEAVQAIIPLFQAEWKEKTGQQVVFKESYEASGAQARAIVQGFEADIALLSLEGDVDKIEEAGLITSDWRSKPHGGMITSSVVALGVRAGNPKQLHDWTDLTKEGIEVLIPNPKTSGGAQWDVNAIYGAGLKISEEAGAANPAEAKELLSQVYRNVKALDKSGRASMTTFEKGIGDVVITYENELLLRNMEEEIYDIIVPNYTIKIVNPVAVIDQNAEKHGVTEVAHAFVDFLWTKEAQEEFAKRGFRAVDPDVHAQYAEQYITPDGLFDIDYLGGWSQVREDIYGDGGIWDQVVKGN
ncbi:sulfate ABC transporter substrate-binding protein [Xylanibacillus composti]|uniref:ABC transporter permease n=1 Tax=Xylanibacillus composti TaxID=1572762 RepID=A0A8J4H4L2_9BACL|nr:sulfate ABC transporter substrate-binding protein [Xylanibacillus composti]MDT9726979.1 sulfate ABC transporter substrate-binding protein [Xylanibacillus composti]GIQ69535.1 ABC transporter permease [Xylanibacillus composti]